MASTAITALTTLANVVKVLYPEQECQKLGFRKYPILAELKKIQQPYKGGKNITYGIETHRASSGGFTTEGEALVDATTPEYLAATDNPFTVYKRRYVSEEAFLDTGGDEASIVQIAQALPKDMIDDLSLHIASGVWYLDSLGAVNLCGTTSASTTLQLDTEANMRLHYENQVLDISAQSTGAATTNGETTTVSKVDEDNCTLTVSTAVTTTAGTHAVYITGEHNNSTTGRIWHGIPEMVGTGSIHGIDPATYNEVKSYVKTSVGTLGLDDVQDLVDFCEPRVKNAKFVIYMSPECSNKYADIFLGDMRYDLSMLEKGVAGYPTNLAFRGGAAGVIPIIRDPLMPLDEIYLLNWPSIIFWSNAFMKWFDRGGSMYQAVSGYLQWEAILLARGQTMIINRPSCAKATGITI